MATQSTLPALQIQQQQQSDLLQKYSQLMALKNSQQQQQMMQQEAPLRMQTLQNQAQSGGLQLQQQQQQLKDQQAITSAMQQWDGKDITALEPLVLKNGGSGQAVIGLKQKQLELHQKYSEIAAQDATTGAKNIETLTKKGDQIAGSLSPLTDPAQVPDAQLVPTLHATVQDLVQKGLLDPQHAQAAEQLAQSNDPNAIRQGVNLFSKGYLAQSVIATNAQKDAQAKRDLAAPVQAAANAAQTAQHNAVEEKQGQQRISLESARLAFDKNRQGTQDGQAIESQAQQIANGNVKGLSQARNNPFARSVMARVYEINPKYSDSLYTATQDLRSSKPNSTGANVGRLGTAILHADSALENSKNLGFSEGLLTGVGTAGTAAYNKDAEFLKGEIGQYVIGKSLTVDEGNKLGNDLYSSRQSVRDAAINEVIKLSGGKLKSQMQTFKNATQNDFPTDRVFNDPEIRGALVKHGVLGPSSQGGGMVTVQIPGSPAGQIPATAVAKFKADHPNAQITQ